MVKLSTVFEKELSLIKNPDIKEFTIQLLDSDSVVDGWKDLLSSASGKFHVINGKVDTMELHTKKMVYFGLEYLDSVVRGSMYRDKFDELWDVVISSSLLHDLWKFGLKGREARSKRSLNPDSLSTCEFHNVYIAKFAPKVKVNGKNFIYEKWYRKIIQAVQWHYGRFGSVIYGEHIANLSANDHRYVVHLADLLSSKYMLTEESFKKYLPDYKDETNSPEAYAETEGLAE